MTTKGHFSKFHSQGKYDEWTLFGWFQIDGNFRMCGGEGMELSVYPLFIVYFDGIQVRCSYSVIIQGMNGITVEMLSLHNI